MGIRFATSVLSVICVAGMATLCGCEKTPAAIPLLQATLDGVVVDMDGASVETAPVLETDYLLLYFSAHWCPPCKTFTPRFIDFYNTQGGGTRFQAVLVSSDKSEEKMFAYMRETQMPWSAIQFGSANAETLKETYSGSGIPRLVLVDPQGEVIADSFEGKRYLGPQHVLNYLREQLGDSEEKSSPAAEPKKLSIQEVLAQHFALNGLAKSGDQIIAIINGEVASVGTELDTGIVVEAITSTYAELSFKGTRYRLYPQASQPSASTPKKQ